MKRALIYLKHIRISKLDKLAFFATLAIGLILFSYAATHHCLSSDGMYYSSGSHISGDWELSLGRWGLQLVDMFRGGIINPILIILLSIILLSLTSVLLIHIIRFKKPLSVFLVSALIALAPQFTESATFLYCFDAYCFAMLLSVLAVYLLLKRTKISYLLSVICIILCCSLYQSYICMTIGLYIVTIITCIINKENAHTIIIDALKHFLIIAISLALYYAITKCILHFASISFASYRGASSSIRDIITSSGQGVLTAIGDFFNFFFTDKIYQSNSYWHRPIINAILFFICSIELLYILFKTKQFKKSPLVFISLCLLPIGACAIDTIVPKNHVNLLMGIGLITPYLLFAILNDKLATLSSSHIYIFSAVPLLILLWTFALGNISSFMVREDTHNNYTYVTQNILSRAESLPGYNNSFSFCFNDIIRYESPFSNRANSYVTTDNETWDSFNGMRNIERFLYRNFGKLINVCTRNKYEQLISTKEYKNMTLYPAEGSIKIIDHTIMVKFAVPEDRLWN